MVFGIKRNLMQTDCRIQIFQNFESRSNDVHSHVLLLRVRWLKRRWTIYGGCQIHRWKKPEYPEKTTDLPNGTDKLYHLMLLPVDLARKGQRHLAAIN